ncbi:hypothetical protein CDAR_33591 [Caerostris darwini]|uniref:Uncharacterized protein n=1 Tax=Caerostris darwini TaxID=1538125 RepID=A0AAV4S1H0_9ARAC|nr:hypothetical protein CDAR_33591 [Caerostris darwini]
MSSLDYILGHERVSKEREEIAAPTRSPSSLATSSLDYILGRERVSKEREEIAGKMELSINGNSSHLRFRNLEEVALPGENQRFLKISYD